MAKPELGVKRIDPETGRKFYDLNRDPIVSPYTGKTYPRSFYAAGAVVSAVKDEEEEVEEKELDAEEATVETVSLEEADEESKGGADEALVGIDDDEVEIEDDEDDTFLEPEEEEDDDMADIINIGDEDEEV